MTSTSAVRSFAITLAIAITIFGPGASGFAIDRNVGEQNNSTQGIDHQSDEPVNLSVTDDVGTPKDTKTSNNEELGKATSAAAASEGVGTTTEQTTKGKIETTLASTQPTTIPSTTVFAKIPTISSDTVEVFDSIEETSIINKSEENSKTTKESSVSQTSTKQTSQTPEPSKSITTTKTIMKTSLPLETSATVNHSEMDQTDTVTTSNAVKETSKAIPQTTEEPTTTDTITVVINSNSTEITDVTYSDSMNITTQLPETISNTSIFSTMQNDDMTLPESKEPPSTTQSPKFIDPFLGKYTKYTTIVRKRVSSSEDLATTTNADEDMMKAETSNTVVNIENAFNATSIPSLDELRADLQSSSSHFSIVTEKPYATEKQADETLLSPANVFEITAAKRSSTVETKRAGFIDNSEKTTTPLTPLMSSEEITTVKETKHETTKGTVNESDTIITESPQPKKASGFESQSQLAEDALQEEFLKEEALQNFEENSKRFREEFSQEVKPILYNSGVPTTSVPNNSSSDDLSVQPIEKYKTTLYTVSPNYKPMKKLDVQPAKPFVRDPDDNSWRNESISSLGIVFKPKNSSKSFKEVLKNKTQTELNSLVEKTKDEVPDLRVRLEKIAEVRKTKKKKLNKDGEVIYTDYEESSSGETVTSAGGTTSPTSDPISSILTSDDLFKLITPNPDPITHSDPQTIPVTTTPSTVTTSTEEIPKRNRTATKSIFSSLGLDGYTTTSPGKFFNAAEYYDTTDEYDADYVTMSKLDLKKFTLEPTEAPVPRPLPPQPPRPVEPHAPERRPTLQYFPPREPQRVNVNHIDEEFERKVNMFTVKEQPREPRPPFVTVPPLPIATPSPPDLPLPPRPAEPARPAARPSDFTITPHELDKNFYMTGAPAGLLGPHLDRGSYVIRHYKDFLRDVAKEDEDRRRDDFLPFHATETTAPPEPGPAGLGTGPERAAFSPAPDRPSPRGVDDDDEYDARFHKDVLTRFVDNFNQNSERFKVDFPILYNSSVVHRAGAGGAPAASRAFLKRYYPAAGAGGAGVATQPAGERRRPCEPHCDLTVELSPAYELHYYVPGQEEREEPRAPHPPQAHFVPPHHPAYRYGL